MNEEQIYHREDRVYQFRKITIEGQLRMYEQHPDRSERSATLWHSWSQNKKWLSRLLELTLASCPSYSGHGISHAEAVIQNIERILGEKRVRELSATDCFAILHVVYVHDIGMTIMAEDRQRIIGSDSFIDMVDDLAQGVDEDMKKYAQILQKEIFKNNRKEDALSDLEGAAYQKEKKHLYLEKLDTYYAIIYLLSEYQRREHGEQSASRVKSWVEDANKLRSEFAMSGIQMRIFLRIAECASLHVDWDFQHILDLPQEEDGYDNDMLHPRFIAVLLQLGDALDIDNDRFHPFAQTYAGQFPMKSQAHYEKHLAIRTLKITSEEIVIAANCRSREALRLVRNECDALESVLKSASYYWSRIAPQGFSGALPSLKIPKLLLNDQKIPLELTMMRFQISQSKAFSLLQGENIYSGHFPFVREMVQNAIDATKMQCFRDYITSSKFRYLPEDEQIEPPSITGISKIINPLEYPIEIEIRSAKEEAGREWCDVEFDAIPAEETEGVRHGILLAIRDHGTGIDTESLKNISKVGTSYKKRKEILRKMPDWLRPTGEFGIGLQSVFLVADKFYCETYVRNGERYKIEFRNGANGDKGYINVEPKNPDDEPMAYGTEFQIFIGHEKKKVRNEFSEAWPGYDPFSEHYEDERIKRDVLQLTAQILMDIDHQVGDLLFPIYAHSNFSLDESLKRLLKQIVFDETERYEKFREKELKEHICWMYEPTGENDLQKRGKLSDIKGSYLVDLKKMQINLWLEEIAVSAQVGVERILNNILNEKSEPCQIYFKGIWVGAQEVHNDSELIERIDIFGKRGKKSLVQLSRNGLTEEGQTYIQDIVIPQIFRILHEALRDMAHQEYIVSGEKRSLNFSEWINENYQSFLNNANQDVVGLDWKRNLIGMSLFYHFYMLDWGNDTIKFPSSKRKEEFREWDQALRAVCDLESKKPNALYNREMVVVSALAVDVLEVKDEFRFAAVEGNRKISIADFFHRDNRFWVVSTRRYPGDAWVNKLVQFIDSVDEENATGFKEYNSLMQKIIKSTEWVGKTDDWSGDLIQRVNLCITVKPTSQQSDFIQRLMRFVPVIANLSDYSGNMRVHILAGRPSSVVAYNRNAKYMLLKKAAKRFMYSNARRAASYVWSGYDVLGVNNVPEDACQIYEKYIYQNARKMLFSCSGEVVQKLVDIVEREDYFNEEKCEELEKLIRVEQALEECLIFDLQRYMLKSEQEELFDEAFKVYCGDRQKRLPKGEFISWMQDLFNTALLEGLHYRSELENADITLAMPTERQISDLATELWEKCFQQVVDQSPEMVIIFGFFADNKDEFCTISRYCSAWISQWERWQKETVLMELEEIENEWRDSRKRENLIEWTAVKNGAEKESVAEWYDKQWKEISDIICERKRMNITKDRQIVNIGKIYEYGARKEL